MYTRLIIPLDGSALAVQALTEAARIVRCCPAPLHLVRVVDLAHLDRASDTTGAVAAAEAALTETAAQLRAQGLAVTTEVRQGAVIDELLRVAEPGDLYILATHGRTGVTRWLLGSVAEALARRSVVPVLLVRALVPSRVGTREARVPATVPAVTPQPA